MYQLDSVSQLLAPRYYESLRSGMLLQLQDQLIVHAALGKRMIRRKILALGKSWKIYHDVM